MMRSRVRHCLRYQRCILTYIPGVHGIFHTASPVDFSLRTWGTVVEPAIRGNATLIESAAAHAGPQLQSIVVTSSGQAMLSPDPPGGYVFTEADQNTWAADLAKTMTSEFPAEKAGLVMYSASKAAADQAMWRFREEKKVKLFAAISYAWRAHRVHIHTAILRDVEHTSSDRYWPASLPSS
jgi:nucleoside-diphosphate-sugar epimerase